MKKKKDKHGKIALLGKTKLDNIEFLILIVLNKFLIDSYFSLNKFCFR